MVVVEKNKVQLEGTLSELLTDLTLVAKQIRKIAVKEFDEKVAEKVADELVQNAVDTAKMTPEELENKSKEAIFKLIEHLMGRGEKNE